MVAVLEKCRGFSSFERRYGIDEPEEIDQLRDTAGPSRLMACAKARSVVAVKILMEQEVVAPMTLAVSTEHLDEPLRDFLRYVEQIHQATRSRGTFDLEVVPIIQIKRHQWPG